MYVKELVAVALMLMVTSTSGQIPWNHRMFRQLPRPEEVDQARTVAELRPYIARDASVGLQWVALFKVAEIGGDEAVDALCEFYQRADSSCGDDSADLPKAGALRLLGRVGGDRAKRLLMGILEYVVTEGPTVTYARPQLSALGYQLYLAALDGLTNYWQDETVLDRLRDLSTDPAELLSSVGASRALEAVLRIEMRRAGIDTLPLKEQVEFLLSKVTSPGFGSETIVAPGRWTYGAVVTEAVADVLCIDFGSHVLPLVEEYVAGKAGAVDSSVSAGLERVRSGIRACGWGEEFERQEIERAREALNRPGARLVVKEDARGKWMEAVPVDTSAVEPDRRGEDEGWRQFFLDIASRPHSTSRDRAWAYRALALTAAKAGQWDLALEYYERMEKEDYEHAFTSEVDFEREKEAFRQRRYPGP